MKIELWAGYGTHVNNSHSYTSSFFNVHSVNMNINQLSIQSMIYTISIF